MDVAYAGGLYSMIAFDREDCMDRSLKSECWKEWFSDLVVWEGKTFPFERLAWLMIVGVPLHMSTKVVFDLIGRKFGEVVFLEDLAEVVFLEDLAVEDGNLSVMCVGILVSHGGEIMEEISLRWKEDSFCVWVREEVGSWVPEGVGRVEPCPTEVEKEGCSDDGSTEMEESASISVVGEEEESDGIGEVNGCMHGEGDNNNEGGPQIFGNMGVKDFNVSVGALNTKDKRKRKWKRNVSRKAGGTNSGGSDQILNTNSDSPRPRKRNRSNGLVNVEGVFGNGTQEIFQNVFGTATESSSSIDLNRPIGSVNGTEGGGLDSRSPLEKEVEATKEVGAKVGIDLDGFEKEIEEAILEEGIDGVQS